MANLGGAALHRADELAHRRDVDTVDGELASLHQRDGFPGVVDRLPAGGFRRLAPRQHVLLVGVEGLGECHGLDGASGDRLRPRISLFGVWVAALRDLELDGPRRGPGVRQGHGHGVAERHAHLGVATAVLACPMRFVIDAPGRLAQANDEQKPADFVVAGDAGREASAGFALQKRAHGGLGEFRHSSAHGFMASRRPAGRAPILHPHYTHNLANVHLLFTSLRQFVAK